MKEGRYLDMRKEKSDMERKAKPGRTRNMTSKENKEQDDEKGAEEKRNKTEEETEHTGVADKGMQLG